MSAPPACFGACADGRVIVLRGDAAHLPLPDASVDLVVTSPPYFGLRSYTDDGKAYAGQLGAESTPREYLGALWDCTREWARVLKPHGSMFVNLGDKYSTYTGANWGSARSLDGYRGTAKVPRGGPVNAPEVYGIPFKSLMGLPWRYALGCTGGGPALADAGLVKLLLRDLALGACTLADAEGLADELAARPDRGLGLTLRAEIVWSKVNGMPESATDRVRRMHEQVFHFVKSPRYFSAVDEIRAPHQPQSLARARRSRLTPDRSQEGVGPPNTLSPADACHPLGKLPGSVWEIPTAPLKVPAELGVEHFAAYPPELVRRIVLGWSPPGICTACGEGRRPVTRIDREPGWTRRTSGERNGNRHAGEKAGQAVSNRQLATITGYACACPPCPKCGDSRRSRLAPSRPCHACPPARPAVVLDPFGGTGTTALVASVLGRTGITVDRSLDYCRLAAWRTRDPGERARVLALQGNATASAGAAA